MQKHRVRASTFAGESDARCVGAESRRIILNPLQRHYLIFDATVRALEKTKDTKPVIEREHHHVLAGGKARRVEKGDASSAEFE